MRIPELTHLQFALLDVLGAVERPGWHIRKRLAEMGEKKTLPAFYQMMSRLEDGGFVKGEYRKADVDGHTVNERWYKITGNGISARDRTLEFYSGKTLAVASRKRGYANA